MDGIVSASGDGIASISTAQDGIGSASGDGIASISATEDGIGSASGDGIASISAAQDGIGSASGDGIASISATQDGIGSASGDGIASISAAQDGIVSLARGGNDARSVLHTDRRAAPHSVEHIVVVVGRQVSMPPFIGRFRRKLLEIVMARSLLARRGQEAIMSKQNRSEHSAPSVPLPSGTYRRVPIRPVLLKPASLLSKRAREIDPRAPGVLQLAEELLTTMRASPACIGLAAPQIGESVRMFAMDVTGHRAARSCAGLVLMVNPRIVRHAGWIEMREGCMSVPDFTGDVWRYEQVVVEGFEPGSTRVLRITADAMEARCLQHEIDHLDGYTFIERTEDLFVRKTYAGTTPQTRCRD